ncbi:MAG: alpha-(1-_3)-arabinofuranosyltransferase domain-containing protein [Acidimicrobiia bacterium]
MTGDHTTRLDAVSPRARRGIGYLALAVLAYVPLLLTAPGKVAADTKQYLYLDPGRLMERAWSMWDPNIGFGTVTHQNIGYLFPMGPFYWVLDRVGVPDWVSQRIWLGTILLFAGLGMLYLFRTLGLRGPGATVGALAFMLSPYSLDYAARISVILLPWAGLPFLLAFVIRGLRQGGWRYPALFALTVQVIGSVNATALVFVGIAPVLWIPYAVWVLGEVNLRRALATVVKIGVLTLGASLWWMSGLWAQGTYGLDILKYTETLSATTRTSLPNEVLRGLGYWFFYGRDKLGPWIEASVDYTQRPFFILVSYGVAVLALLSAAFVRWRERAFFILVAFVGVVVAVGAHPYDSPTPFGSVFKQLATESTAAFALRSTGRATPLVVLGLAGLLAAGVNAVTGWLTARGHRGRALILAAAVGALVVVNLPALWNGTFYGKNLQRPEDVPQYWKDAAKHLDEQPHDTRALELPGADFASYRWGNTVDPITPGLMDRPYVARELIPYGSPASANLLNAFDLRIQDRQLPPDAISPMARMMSVGDIVLRNDLQFERYRVIRPKFLWQLFTPTPTGLETPTLFGKPEAIQSTLYPFLDEQALGGPANLPTPPPVAIFGVKDPTKIVSAKPQAGSVVIAGDGDGMVDASVAKLLDRDPLVFYSAGFAADPTALKAEVDRGATLVVTDSNRDRARRWSTITDTQGYTEGPGTHPLEEDLSDARLDMFPDASSNAYTTTELVGAKGVAASSYGNPITYTPEDRAARAFDGDLATAWRTGAFDNVRGDRIRVVPDAPITTDHVNLVQVLKPPNERYITRATLRFDGGSPVSVDLGRASRTAAGQTIRFPRRTFRSFEITIQDTNLGQLINYGGVSPVGFAEIRLRDDAPGSKDVRISEIVKMPSDLLSTVGAASAQRPLVLLMNRERVIPVPPRSDPELSMVRQFALPTARSFGIGGEARLSPFLPDAQIDRLLGYEGPVTASSSEHLSGAPQDRAYAALDQNPATAWVTPFSQVTDQSVDVSLPAPITLDHLDLQLVADGQHSVPTKISITNEAGDKREVDVPGVTDRPEANAVAPAPVQFAPLSGSQFRVTVLEARDVTTREWYCECDLNMPVGIAELGMAGVPAVRVAAQIPDQCRNDLITIDDEPVPTRIVGTTADALALQPLSLVSCADSGTPVTSLTAGRHVLRTQPGNQFGFDVNRLTLASKAGGEAWTTFDAQGGLTDGAAQSAPPAEHAPKVKVLESGRAKTKVRVTGATKPFWLVLGQSNNAGWRATADGKELGESTLADGYGNGWLIRPTRSGRAFEVSLEWVPQRTVNRAIALSLVSVFICLVIVLVSVLRRRRRGGIVAAGAEDVDATLASPLVAFGHQPGWVGVTLATLVALVAGGVFVTPWVGVLLAAAVLLVLVRPRWRSVLSLVPAVALAGCGAYIAAKQWHARLPATFEWPTFFWQVRTLGWIAIVFLAGDALVEIVRTHTSRRRRRQAALSAARREAAGSEPDSGQVDPLRD